MWAMLKPVKVRINTHKTDRLSMCRKVWTFSQKLMPKIHDKHALNTVNTGNILLLQVIYIPLPSKTETRLYILGHIVNFGTYRTTRDAFVISCVLFA